MKRRRNQFFAPAIKALDVDREHFMKDYDDYVMRKHRLKVDPEMIDETFTKRKILFRRAST